MDAKAAERRRIGSRTRRKVAVGRLQPDEGARFGSFVESSTAQEWAEVVAGSRLSGRIAPADLERVWRRAQGRD